MAFDGTEAGPIDISKAGKHTRNWRTANPNQPKAYFFGKDIINQLLSNPDAMGIRVYFAKESDEYKLIMVAADGAENDITSLVANYGVKCPTVCSTPNGLNS